MLFGVVFLLYNTLTFLGEFELPFDEEWEIDERQLSIKEQLGEGAFGLVMKAEAFDLPGYPRSHIVAVKMLKRKLLSHTKEKTWKLVL